MEPVQDNNWQNPQQHETEKILTILMRKNNSHRKKFI